MSASLSLCILLQIFDISTPKLVHPFWNGWHCSTSDIAHYIHTNPKLGSELTVAHSAKQNDVRKVQHFTNVWNPAAGSGLRTLEQSGTGTRYILRGRKQDSVQNVKEII